MGKEWAVVPYQGQGRPCAKKHWAKIDVCKWVLVINASSIIKESRDYRVPYSLDEDSWLCVCFLSCFHRIDILFRSFVWSHCPLDTSHNWSPFCNYYIKRNYVYNDRTEGATAKFGNKKMMILRDDGLEQTCLVWWLAAHSIIVTSRPIQLLLTLFAFLVYSDYNYSLFTTHMPKLVHSHGVGQVGWLFYDVTSF